MAPHFYRDNQAEQRLPKRPPRFRLRRRARVAVLPCRLLALWQQSEADDGLTFALVTMLMPPDSPTRRRRRHGRLAPCRLPAMTTPRGA